jgi:hypothetical protein
MSICDCLLLFVNEEYFSGLFFFTNESEFRGKLKEFFTWLARLALCLSGVSAREKFGVAIFSDLSDGNLCIINLFKIANTHYTLLRGLIGENEFYAWLFA